VNSTLQPLESQLFNFDVSSAVGQLTISFSQDPRSDADIQLYMRFGQQPQLEGGSSPSNQFLFTRWTSAASNIINPYVGRWYVVVFSNANINSSQSTYSLQISSKSNGQERKKQKANRFHVFLLSTSPSAVVDCENGCYGRGRCVNGECQCYDPLCWTGNCGNATDACFPGGSDCIAGQCRCKSSKYSGTRCEPICTKPCLNGGTCIAPDLCDCSKTGGYSGAYCQNCKQCPSK
jgi:hypothetical protein